MHGCSGGPVPKVCILSDRGVNIPSSSIPVAIGFTTETDGYLPCGKTLKQAITMVDADEKYRPVYYLVNCAHPDHFIPTMRYNITTKNQAPLKWSANIPHLPLAQ